MGHLLFRNIPSSILRVTPLHLHLHRYYLRCRSLFLYLYLYIACLVGVGYIYCRHYQRVSLLLTLRFEGMNGYDNTHLLFVRYFLSFLRGCSRNPFFHNYRNTHCRTLSVSRFYALPLSDVESLYSLYGLAAKCVLDAPLSVAIRCNSILS